MDNQDIKEHITISKKAELEIELERLQTTERKEVLGRLEFAKLLGDLKENAEYHEAREAQGKLEARIKHILHILKHAEIIDEGKSYDRVEMGATVTVLNQTTNESKKLQIVGPQDADIAAGRISHTSPLAQILIHKKVGDTAMFNSPKGEITYKIIEIV
ncbi:MAG: transcription elongation factor GreA [Candidatus Pacebacteria bacterium]|nr:transcription elongation factor GreA [Candidatus Paceibacterota bacterium]